MKCPWCHQYSLAFDLERNGWVCHVYNGFTPDEHMPVRLPIPRYRRTCSTTRWFDGIGYVTH